MLRPLVLNAVAGVLCIALSCVGPASTAAAAADAQPAVRAAGSGAAVADLMFGRVPYILLDRPLTPTERVPYQKLHGHLPLTIPIARIVDGPLAGLHGPYALYVATANPLRAISREQYLALLSEGQPGGSVLRWSQLSIDPAWQGRAVTVYGPEAGDANYETWRAAQFGRRPAAPGMIAVADERARLARVAQDTGGLALAPSGLQVAGVRQVKTLDDATHDGGSFLYVHIGVDQEGRADFKGWAYADAALSTKARGAPIEGMAGLAPLPADMAAAVRGKLDAAPRAAQGALSMQHDHRSDPAYIEPDGTISIVGNDGMEDMLGALNALYASAHPGVAFRMRMEGSSTGGPALIAGVTPFAPMSRALWPADLDAFKQRHGYEPLDIRVGYAGHGPRPGGKTPPALYVHRSNPVQGLDMAQVRRIFTSGQIPGDIDHWGQVGVQGKWADRRIHVYGLRDDGGSATSARMVLLDGMPFNARYEALSTPADVVRAVANDPFGIGMTGWVDAASISSDVRVLPLAQAPGDAYVLPDIQHVAAGEYPFSSYLHFYVNRRPGTPLPAFISSYLEMVLSPAGQAIIATYRDSEGGYVPLAPGLIEAERKKLR